MFRMKYFAKKKKKKKNIACFLDQEISYRDYLHNFLYSIIIRIVSTLLAIFSFIRKLA